MSEVTVEDGIKAIIFLQAMAGIEETEEKARLGWENMQPWEQETTLRFYNQLSPERASVEGYRMRPDV